MSRPLKRASRIKKVLLANDFSNVRDSVHRIDDPRLNRSRMVCCVPIGMQRELLAEIVSRNSGDGEDVWRVVDDPERCPCESNRERAHVALQLVTKAELRE